MKSQAKRLHLVLALCTSLFGIASFVVGEQAAPLPELSPLRAEEASLERAAPSSSTTAQRNLFAGSDELPRRAPSPREASPALEAPRVLGRVLDEQDHPVSRVTVVLYRGRERHTSLTDAEGRYAFERLVGGRYRAFIEPRNLPEGFLPPWRQQLSRPQQSEPTGFFGTTFDLVERGQHRVDLRVFRSSSLSGWVQDEQGVQVADAVVRVRSRRGVSLETRTDASGAFLIEGAWPGEYEAQVTLGGSAGVALFERSFELMAGEDRVLPASVVERGSLAQLAPPASVVDEEIEQGSGSAQGALQGSDGDEH